MKRSTLFLCFAVWSISLMSTYYLGTRSQQDIENATDTPQISPVGTAGRILEPIDKAARIEESISPIQSFLDGKAIPLEEALREIPFLSNHTTRQLLGEAFDLPKSDPNRGHLIRELLGQLSETEPTTALELAAQIESLRDSERARIAILQIWGKNDPAATLSWSNQALAGEPARARLAQLSAIYRGYAASNPEAAFQQALSLEDDNRLRNRLLGNVIETQIESGGLMAAKLAVDLISDPEIQNSLRRELVNEWAAFDPEAAANYVLSLGDAAETRLKSTLLSEWAESDPTAAASWLSHLPEDDPAIAWGSASIIQKWTRYDLVASAEWLNSLPAGPELDRAVIRQCF